MVEGYKKTVGRPAELRLHHFLSGFRFLFFSGFCFAFSLRRVRCQLQIDDNLIYKYRAFYTNNINWQAKKYNKSKVVQTQFMQKIR